MENLQHSLDLKMLSPAYLFYGEETLLMEQAIQRVASLALPEGDQWGRELYYGDEVDIASLVQSARITGMFTPRKLIVVRNIPWFKRKSKAEGDSEPPQDKAELQPLLDYLADPNPDTVLILTAAKTDRGSRLHKALVKYGRAVEFITPTGMKKEAWLNAYLQKAGKTAEAGVVAHICLLSAEGLTALAHEADKLILYCADKPSISMADAQAVVSQGALAGVFELADLAAEKKGAAAAAVYRRLLKQREEPYGILALLGSQYRNSLAIKDLLARGFNSQEAAAKLGIAPYAAQKNARLSRRYSYAQLQKALEILLNADIDGKSGGSIAYLLEVAILRICAI